MEETTLQLNCDVNSGYRYEELSSWKRRANRTTCFRRCSWKHLGPIDQGTQLRPPLKEEGRTAAALLLGLLARTEEPRGVVLSTESVERGSVKSRSLLHHAPD